MIKNELNKITLLAAQFPIITPLLTVELSTLKRQFFTIKKCNFCLIGTQQIPMILDENHGLTISILHTYSNLI